MDKTSDATHLANIVQSIRRATDTHYDADEPYGSQWISVNKNERKALKRILAREQALETAEAQNNSEGART